MDNKRGNNIYENGEIIFVGAMENRWKLRSLLKH